MNEEPQEPAAEGHQRTESDLKVIKHIDDGSDRSISSKMQERLELQKQMDAFLQSGGKIQVIKQNVLADPPKRPISNYGSRPI